MKATLDRLILYVRDPDAVAQFYFAHFDYVIRRVEGDGLIELIPPGHGVTLLLHKAARGQRVGQAQVKLVFAVDDLDHFVEKAGSGGLEFGKIWETDSYRFCNAKDPAGNSIQITTRPRA